MVGGGVIVGVGMELSCLGWKESWISVFINVEEWFDKGVVYFGNEGEVNKLFRRPGLIIWFLGVDEVAIPVQCRTFTL